MPAIGDEVHLSDFERDTIHRLALARQHAARQNKIVDRKIGRQSAYETDLEGIAAEIAFCKLFNAYPDLQTDTRPSFDCILPCGLRVDVKSTRYKRGHLLVAPWKKKIEVPDLYVLMVGSFPGPYVLRGFLPAGEMLVEDRLKDFGHGKGYSATQKELRELDDILREFDDRASSMR